MRLLRIFCLFYFKFFDKYDIMALTQNFGCAALLDEGAAAECTYAEF